MLKKPFILLALFITSHASICQSVKLGVLGGLNGNQMRPDFDIYYFSPRDNGSIQPLLGGQFGIILTKQLSSKVNLKSGVLTKLKRITLNWEFYVDGVIGYDDNGRPFYGISKIERTYNISQAYLSIPFFLEYSITPRVKITGGPNLDISYYNSISNEGNPNDYGYYSKAKYESEQFDFGINLGPTVSFKRIDFSFLYNRNFMDVSKYFSEADISGYKFHALEINLIYYL